MKDLSRVSLAAIGNFVVVGTATVLDKTSQILHLILVSGQIGVAIITVAYIWKKIKTLKKSK